MRRLILSSLAAALLPLASIASATTWEIDPAHTSVQFSVRHLMISNVRGEFGTVTGSVRQNDRDIAASAFEATIDATSITTRDAKRDAHLRGPDFLDVAQYPTIHFVSKRLEPAGTGHWKVLGELTLHGVTREITLDVDGPTPEMKDPSGTIRAGAAATTKINRKDFGINWNKALDAGGVAVSDEVAITIDVEAIKQVAPAATPTAGAPPQ
jgi:polyisoprenoid-binding protein YceI